MMSELGVIPARFYGRRSHIAPFVTPRQIEEGSFVNPQSTECRLLPQDTILSALEASNIFLHPPPVNLHPEYSDALRSNQEKSTFENDKEDNLSPMLGKFYLFY